MDLKNMTLLILVVILQLGCVSFEFVLGNVVLPVQHKFKGRKNVSLKQMRAHDSQRHARLLSAVDMPLGGNRLPTEFGLYYTKISLGSPSKDFHVQVDTGSDTLWVNCAGCGSCPKKSKLVELTQYDPKGSLTGRLVHCDDDFCTSTYNGELAGCKPNLLCQYTVLYGDGSSTAGYYVEDVVQLDRVTGNLQSSPMNGSVIFGCAVKQAGSDTDQALDGIIGFGQANSSMISQLAAAGKVNKVFSHCLDGENGGGIFAIGELVQPKVKTTRIIPNKAHYNVMLKDVEVDGDILPLPSDMFENDDHRGVIIDSGTTLAYLPDELYESLMSKIMAKQPQVKVQAVLDQYNCFYFSQNVDDAFPTVTFHFEDKLSLAVYPHEYLFRIGTDQWCIGWMSSGIQSKDGKDMTILGDLALADKLVVYDLENQVIGWREYNCSSRIKVKVDDSGAEYFVGAEDMSSASCHIIGRMLTSLLILVAVLHNLTC